MNNLLLKMIERKNKMYNKCVKQPLNIELKHDYSVYKNYLINEIRHQKNEYYKNILVSNNNNPKKQWDTIKTLIGEQSKGDDKIFLKDMNNVLIRDPLAVTNILNDYFCSVASDLRESIKIDQTFTSMLENEYRIMFKQESCDKSVFFYPTCKEEILEIIKSLSNRKAPGADSITPMILKSIDMYIVDVLVYLINFSMSSGEFPLDLKTAIVKPLFKKNDKTIPGNYRPIALLSIFSKLLEKIIKVRLVNFLEKYNYFSDKQFGFRKKLSTSSALIHFMGQVYTGLNNGKYCAGLFVDVMKAFDTVDHFTLLTRLEEAGVRGVPLQWFQSYLSGRTQRTKVAEAVSDLGDTEHGIPQGSVLSGPLFLVYANNLCDGRFKGNLCAFADDTALFYEANSLEQLKINMQCDVNALRWWFTSNFMVMSPKTKYIIFNLSKNVNFTSPIIYHNASCNNANLICKCQEIEKVNEIKYLGLYLDSKVNWKTHINYVQKKLVKYIRVFYLLKYVCNQHLLRTVYFAMINSKLEYGLTIYGGAYKTSLQPLIVLQKAFVRIISNKIKTEHAAPLFKTLEILPLRNLYIFKVLRVFFERSGNAGNINLDRKVTLRNKNDADIPKPNLTAFKKFYLFLAPKFFNRLPESIKICKNKVNFAKQLRSFLINLENVDSLYE